MKTISKENFWIGHDRNYKLYCFEQTNDKYRYSQYNYFKFLSDITVNDDNQIHSFNDQPLIYKDGLNRLCKVWFINGLHKRLNSEKPRTIIKTWGYVFNDGSYVSIEKLKENLR